MARGRALLSRQWIELLLIGVSATAVMAAARYWPEYWALLWGGFWGAWILVAYVRMRGPVNYRFLRLSSDAIEYAESVDRYMIRAGDIKTVAFVREQALFDDLYGPYLETKWSIEAGGRTIEVMDEWPDRGRLLRWFRRLPGFDAAAAKAGLRSKEKGRWACFPRG